MKWIIWGLVVALMAIVMVCLLLMIALYEEDFNRPPSPDPILFEVVKTEYITEYVTENVTEYIMVPYEKVIYSVPRHFETLAEARRWVADHVIEAARLAVQGDRCKDYAATWVQLGLEDGYIIYEEAVEGGKIFGHTVTPITEYHIGNTIRIGDDYYYLEGYPSETRGTLVYAFYGK